MGKGHKIRFLLYGLATIGNLNVLSAHISLFCILEAMFDLSLVALAVEILLELCSTVLSEKKRWVLYGLVAAGTETTDTLILSDKF